MLQCVCVCAAECLQSLKRGTVQARAQGRHAARGSSLALFDYPPSRAATPKILPAALSRGLGVNSAAHRVPGPAARRLNKYFVLLKFHARLADRALTRRRHIR